MTAKNNLSRMLILVFTFLMAFSLVGLAQDDNAETTLKTQVMAHCGGPGWHAHGWYVGKPCATLKEPVYETLVKQRFNREKGSWSLVPGLAKEWSHSEDYGSWTFELREDATWHDGEKFTAEDVKFTMDMYLHPDAMGVYGPPVANALKGYDAYKNGEADTIEGVKVVDEYTVEFNLAKPRPTYDKNLRFIPIVPAHRFEDMKMSDIPSSEKWKKPVGTGSFQFVRNVPEEFTVLEKFEDYYMGEPKIDRWIAYYNNSPESKISRLKKGEVDATRFAGRAVTPGMAEQINSLGGYNVWIDDTYLVGIFALQPQTEALNNIKVRRAIMHAVDRDTLKQILPFVKLHNVMGVGQYQSDKVRTYEYSPEKSKQLLEDAGWNQKQPLILGTNYQGSGVRKALVAIAGMLEEVGVQVEVRQVDTPTWVQDWQKTGDEDLTFNALLLQPPLAGWTEWVTQENLYPQGPNPGYYLPEIDALADRATSLPPGKEKRSVVEAAQMVMNEKAWIVPLFLRSEGFVLSKRVDTGSGSFANHGIHIGRDWRFFDWSIKE